jgi:hypothetical protein
VLTEAVSYTQFRPKPAALATLRVLLEAGAAPRADEEAPLITAMMGPVAPVTICTRHWPLPSDSIRPQGDVTPGPVTDGVMPEPIDSSDKAQAWFTTEDAVLRGTVENARANGFDTHTTSTARSA